MAAIAPPDTARVAAAPAESTGELLVARTWTRVRKSRSARAPLEFILTPGDTVLADSLEGGWYRVALDGDVLGYAHGSTLLAPGARWDNTASKIPALPPPAGVCEAPAGFATR